jgi:hypothetical protein
MLEFKRKIHSCDENDQDIRDGSTFMIFAWHKDDPENNQNNWKYHGINRKIKTALLLDFKDKDLEAQENSLPSDTITFDIIPSHVKIFNLRILSNFLENSRLMSLIKIPSIIVKYSNYQFLIKICI